MANSYFRAWSRSGTARRLRHTRLVQVAPCTVLGLYSYGPTRYATARPLTGQEAARADRKLARKYPIQQRFVIRLLRRTRRWQIVHYELLAHDATGG
jgi:PPOX class probable F420-dependent enzyme